MRSPIWGEYFGANFMNKKNLALLIGGFALSLAASGADKPAGPFDAKARELFAKVISIPTSIGNGKVPEMAEYLAQEFRVAGFPADDIHIIPFNKNDNATASFVVRYRGDGSGGKPILLLSHMDVVTAKREDWVRDPYVLTEEDGYFFGRGTKDVKDGVVLLTTTFLRLKKEGFKPKRDFIIYFSGDEETAMDTTVDIVKNHRELIDAEYALNSDAGGAVLNEITGKPQVLGLSTAEKAYVDFTLTTHNPGGHSSRPRADNAIYDLATALTKISQYTFPIMTNETTLANLREQAKNTQGPLGDALHRFVDNPKDAEAAKIIGADSAFVGRIRTTCVATMLKGGHAQNALPQSAEANINCRIFPGVKVAEVQKTLQGIVGEGAIVAVIGEPMSSDPSPLRADVLSAVTRAVQKKYPGVPLVPQQDSGASDGLVFRSGGIPTYGVETVFAKSSDDFSHGLNERIPVQSFYDSLEIWYSLLKDLGSRRAK
jgi:acetylornithine deacetylase/succinyl-diaminopimelate desuccinylase-like protein